MDVRWKTKGKGKERDSYERQGGVGILYAVFTYALP
jgi:hypothetical protein